MPLAIPLSILTKAKSGRDADHVINNGRLKKIKSGIENASAVIVDPGRKTFFYVTNVYQDGKAMIVSFDQDSLFDGDRVHEATSIHLGSTLEGKLVHLPGSVTVFVKNENELARAAGKADILSRLTAQVKLVDKIAQEDADVKRENAIKESRKATDDLGAIMSEARIDALIKDSGAGKRKDYARRWITSINPTDFINLTTGKTQDRSVFDRMPGERGSTVDEYDYVQGLKGRYQVEQTVGKKQWTRRQKKSKIQEERILLQLGRDQLSDLGKQQKHACRVVIQEGKPKRYDLLHNVRRRQSATDNTSAIQ